MPSLQVKRNNKGSWAIPRVIPRLWCYACQLGNQDEAWEWLTDAIDLSDTKEVKTLALNDPDLEPLWAEIGEV
jgi:hypothetical protein